MLHRRKRDSLLTFLLTFMLSFTIGLSTATAQKESKKAAAPKKAQDNKGKKKDFKYAVGLRGAVLFIPDFTLKLFLEEGVGTIRGGGGAEFVLKASSTFEYAFGFGYNSITFGNDPANPSIFLQSGKGVHEREIIENTLSYLELDVRFVKIFPIKKHFQIILGGGLGLGILLGQVSRTDTHQDGSGNTVPCKGPLSGPACQLHEGLDKDKDIVDQDIPQGRRDDRVPPVIPVLNFLFGMAFPINERFDVRLQGGFGIPRVFWIGLSSHYYF